MEIMNSYEIYVFFKPPPIAQGPISTQIFGALFWGIPMMERRGWYP